MKIIILAGGRSTRLQHSAEHIPKALVEVGGKPILQHQIDLLEKYGFNDIRLALGFKANQIIEYLNGKYEYVVEAEPLDTGGAIKFASKGLTEPFLVLNGDIISNLDFTKFTSQAQKDKNYLTIAYNKQNTDFGLVQIDKNGKIIKFLEKPQTPTDGYVSVGSYILQPEIFKNVHQKIFSIEYDIFPKLASQEKLYNFEHTGFWYDIGTESRIKLVSKLILNSFNLFPL